ncbi:MAG: ArnT family glycosyltransferase [Janthinobacterium lividum]
MLQITFLLLLWAMIYVFSLTSPPLLDDADSTHAQAAQTMLRTGDWVTLHVDGVRYLEKPPLPYWLTAISLRVFGMNSFAVHLPLALTVLGLAALGWVWARRAFGERQAFYTALFTLTATGTFLFTRIFIPDALLSLLLAFVLYAALRALNPASASPRFWAGAAWLALAAAVLTKGLVALVFIFGTLAVFLPLSGSLPRWKRLSPAIGMCLFLAVAAPWHLLAGLRNRGGANGHGFFWFYFVNEHLLRFLGRRSPPDYNKLPTALYWSLHLVWLFPWSFFFPVLVKHIAHNRKIPRRAKEYEFPAQTVLVLTIFFSLVLVFFSLSTNQEYYTFPVYLPLLLLTSLALCDVERLPLNRSGNHSGNHSGKLLFICQAALAVVGLLAGIALGLGLWSSRGLPAATDVGDLLAHRGVGNYTLSMSHFFDLTGPSFSALRLPASVACVALIAGPLLSLLLRVRERHLAATTTLALMSTAFLVAAHLALNRFAPMLSSQDFAARIQALQQSGEVAKDSEVLLFGDQAFGSSIPFYLGHPVGLVDGRSTSMLFGSTFPDAPNIFFTHQQLLADWGYGPRKLLFVPLEQRPVVTDLLGANTILIYENSGKALLTDRPLAQPAGPVMDSSTPHPEQ